jgi:hypothetical protein
MSTAIPAGAGSSGGSGVSEGGGSSDIGSASSGAEFDARGSGGAGEAGGDGGGFPGAGADDPAQGGAAPFQFGRRQWPSQERAENEFLNTIGRLQATQRQLQDRDRELETLRAFATKAGAGGGGAGEGASGGEGAATVQEAVDQILDPDSLDWELITDAMRERGPEVGLYLFAQKLSGALGKGFDARMKTMSETLSGFQQGSQMAQQAGKLWDGAVMAAAEDGNLYFPELSTPENLQTAMAIWREITDGMPPEVAFHPRMARMAILEMRAMLAAEGGGGATDGNGAGSGSADAGPAVNPEAVAAAHVQRATAQAAGRGVLPPGRGTQPGARQRPETEESRIKRTLMSGGQEVGQLGFRR